MTMITVATISAPIILAASGLDISGWLFSNEVRVSLASFLTGLFSAIMSIFFAGFVNTSA